MRLSHYRVQDYIPKLFFCLKQGYTKSYFFNDLFAGISVGIIALSLSLAFAIGSGVSPERGLFTAIIGGFLISFLGGSRVQIGGPAGVFIVVVYSIIQKYGYDGLATATIIAGILLIFMGIARFGILLKFISFPVITGFTTGISLVIFTSQIKDFFGLHIDQVPPQFLDQLIILYQQAYSYNQGAFFVAISILVLMFILRKYLPKIPSAMVAIIYAMGISYIFNLPLETIQSKFGEIPRMLPMPSFPSFSYDLMIKVFPDAITIALLGAIESLLSAMVADGMIGSKHRSNCELVAQGVANIGSIIFGGIPATGAIARTTANIRMGAKTPVAGMIHAITVFLLMFFLAPFVSQIPLCALSAVLMYVAWNMSELGHFIEILKGEKSEALILLITFILTVVIDLSVAVQIGVIVSAVIFVKKMADKTEIEVCKILVDENSHETSDAKDADILLRKDIPDDVMVFEINGPFFYSVADLLDETLLKLDTIPRVFILHMKKVPIIDTTGMKALKEFQIKCKRKEILFLLTGVSQEIREKFKKVNVEKTIGKEHIFTDITSALVYVQSTHTIKE